MPAPSPAAPDPRFRGCFTALVTPFSPGGESVDFARLESQIAFQAAAKVAGVVLCGTTGEAPTLEHGEYEEVVQRGVATAHRHRLTAIVGTGSNSTAHAVAMHRFAARAGADASLSVNPYYNRPTAEGLYRHFAAVADAADLPVILYNIPGRTSVALTIDTIERLAHHPNIRAIKDATGGLELAGEAASRCPSLAVLSGDDPLTLPMIAVGACGVVSVASNIVPEAVARLCAHALAAENAPALAAHRQLLPLIRALFAESNPIPVKAAMALLGRDTGAVRLPMTPAGAATVERLKAALTGLELL